jgi:hypothetical protein
MPARKYDSLQFAGNEDLSSEHALLTDELIT